MNFWTGWSVAAAASSLAAAAVLCTAIIASGHEQTACDRGAAAPAHVVTDAVGGTGQPGGRPGSSGGGR